jgi:hypothetical protein
MVGKNAEGVVALKLFVLELTAPSGAAEFQAGRLSLVTPPVANCLTRRLFPRL